MNLLDGDSRTAARALLGAVLIHAGVAVQLTETEAYAGLDDPGSHAYRGRTPRTEVMFGPSGRLYVYFIYGMHFCVNVVTGPEGEPGGVLLRAGRVLDGLDLARERAGAPGPDHRLARGPARLARVLSLTKAHNGANLHPHSRTPIGEPGTGPRLWLPGSAHADPNRAASQALPVTSGPISSGPVGAGLVSCGPRVGLRQGADLPWRFWLTGDPTVTDYRPAAKRG